jgi:hypothetical protein
VPTLEDILSDPSTIPYTPDIHTALAPSIQVLQKILLNPEDQDAEGIPAKKWLEGQGKNVGTGIVPFTGNLSVIERAKLGNWFEIHIATGDQSLRRHWLGLLPFAHTCTLWLVSLIHKHKGDLQKFDTNDDKEVLQAAWKEQTTISSEKIWMDGVDVDKESLERLEEEMFERSVLAGIAGNYQWGLDAGDHQGNWNPYGGSEHLHIDDRESDEDEHEVCILRSILFLDV